MTGSLINSTTIVFKNKPTPDGFKTFSVKDCIIAPNGSPNTSRPQIIIHLPKASTEDVDGAWIDYDGHWWHVIGTNARLMDNNKPNRWDRYCIAERVRIL